MLWILRAVKQNVCWFRRLISTEKKWKSNRVQKYLNNVYQDNEIENWFLMVVKTSLLIFTFHSVLYVLMSREYSLIKIQHINPLNSALMVTWKADCKVSFRWIFGLIFSYQLVQLTHFFLQYYTWHTRMNSQRKQSHF